MRVQAELFRNRRWLEALLAIAAVGAVLYVMLAYPEGPFDSKTWFTLAMGIGAWVPLLARTSWRRLGDVRLDARALVIRTRLRARRIPFGQIRGVRVARGRRGASILVSLRDGTLLAFAADSPFEAASFGDELRQRAETADEIQVPTRKWVRFAMALRVLTSLAALAYYLFEVRDLIPGDKALYGLTGVAAGFALLVWHLAGRRAPFVVAEDSHWPLAVGDLFGNLPRSLRAHLDVHAKALTSEQPPASHRTGEPLLLPDETAAQALTRMRAQLERDAAYRGEAAALRGRLEQAVSAGDASVIERAIALRIVSEGARPDVQRRLADVTSLPEDERACLEAIATADDDRRAAALLGRWAPRVEA